MAVMKKDKITIFKVNLVLSDTLAVVSSLIPARIILRQISGILYFWRFRFYHFGWPLTISLAFMTVRYFFIDQKSMVGL